MAQEKVTYLDFEVDKLTKSIENTISGDSFQTEVSRMTEADLNQLSKRKGWQFNWREELAHNDRDVYKLTITNNISIIQGLMSISIENDHIFMHLLESAPFNLGKNKIYEGVPANLVAYACQVSFRNANEGFVSFRSKTKLVNHYIKTLGAYNVGGNLMIIPTPSAQLLIDKYYKN